MVKNTKKMFEGVCLCVRQIFIEKIFFFIDRIVYLCMYVFFFFFFLNVFILHIKQWNVITKTYNSFDLSMDRRLR